MSSATGEVYRIAWLPGTDVLHGTCHCGAEHDARDPVEMWEWMLGHPEGHRPPSPRKNTGNPGHAEDSTESTESTESTDTTNNSGSPGTSGNGSNGNAA